MEEDLFVVIVGDPPLSQLPFLKSVPSEDFSLSDFPLNHIIKQDSQHSDSNDFAVRNEPAEYLDIKEEPQDADYLNIKEPQDADYLIINYESPQSGKSKKAETKAKKKKKWKTINKPRLRSLGDTMRATDLQSVCPVCKEEFGNVTDMQIHTSTVHKELLLPFKCAHCPAAYPHVVSLKRHEKVQHSGIKYICDMCKRVFNKKDNLITHINVVHSGIKRFVCDFCSKRYKKKFNLNIHVDKIHKKIPPPFVCDTCPTKRYYLMSELRTHMMKEHGVTLMTNTNFINKLPTMDKRQLENTKIVTKEQLEQLRAKTQEKYTEEQRQLERDLIKKFACQHCSKRYAKIFNLNMHIMREHENVTPPFACEICNKRFYAMFQRTEHMKKEHNVKLMSKKKIMDKLNSMDNAKILTKEEFQKLSENQQSEDKKDLKYISMLRYPCTECNSTFELKSELKNHIEKEHCDDSFTCQMCRKEYSRFIALKRHMKYQHNMNIITKQKFQNLLPKLSKAQIESAKVILK